jgi:hypothetical protein
MITLLSSFVISLSERHLVSAKTAISFHRSSCLLCFKHFRSSVKRSSIDTRSVVWVPFHISPSASNLHFSPVNIETSVMRCLAGRSPSVFSRRPSLGPSVWAYVFPSPTYASCCDVMQETVANHVGDISFALSLALYCCWLSLKSFTNSAALQTLSRIKEMHNIYLPSKSSFVSGSYPNHERNGG